MAIVKRSSGNYQVKLQGIDDRWICRTFQTKQESQDFEFQLKKQKREGTAISLEVRDLIVDHFFSQWFETAQSRDSEGWRKEQWRLYQVYVRPVMGHCGVAKVTPQIAILVLSQRKSWARRSKPVFMFSR